MKPRPVNYPETLRVMVPKGTMARLQAAAVKSGQSGASGLVRNLILDHLEGGPRGLTTKELATLRAHLERLKS